MWPMPVVVLDVDPKDLLEVAAPNNQQPVQALGTDRAHPALRVGVRSGCPHRRNEHPGSLRAEHIAEPAAELRVVVTHDEACPPPSFSQDQQQVAGLLGDPAAVGIGGHPGQVDPPGVQFDEEQHVQPPQPDRIDGEEVAGEDAGVLQPRGERVPQVVRAAQLQVVEVVGRVVVPFGLGNGA